MKNISVIIPMYHAEAFIRQCVRSVQDQSEQSWELIIIDDGSTDLGPAICEELGREDDRIRLYRQENRGVSHARNRGIDLAEGKYVFFLDSDDMIHPRLLEEMLEQAEEYDCKLVFCGYTLSDGSPPGGGVNAHLQWQTAEGREVQGWFHKKYINEMSGIGGKLINREAIGALRFDEGLANGEDTYFLYQLVCKGIRSAYTSNGWYYYRMHQESVTHSENTRKADRYYECSRRIRDSEYRKGNLDYALTWEILLTGQIEKNHAAQRRAPKPGSCGQRSKCEDSSKQLCKIATAERRHPMFRRMYLSNKVLFYSCFYCYPLYVILKRVMAILQNDLHIYSMKDVKEVFCRISGRKGESRMKRKNADVGILTFHCSNNYGAMLQAYGLKRYLQSRRIRTDIVRYEPIYMTGRHWWIPYSPIRGLKGRIWGVMNMWNGFLAHMRMREDFSRQRRNMNRFRFRYLVDKRKHRVLFERGLTGLPYRYYVVGSDQIWNPHITCGFRRAYFGAFENKQKKRVISYAASFGSSKLDSKYDREFSELIGHVDAVSVREEAAVPYVERLSGREVTAVLDPVFFLGKEDWQKVETDLEREGFIFLYITEKNEAMAEYARRLSHETGLPVVEVRATMVGADADFEVDHGAGPSEFLGYIDKADYVVSNSFHAVAFCIIYRKRFLAFAHSNLGARVRNILKIHGLLEKLYELNGNSAVDWQRAREQMDAPVDWDAVGRKTKEQTKLAGDFLMKNIGGIAR
jgi:glycosyltransferase involved in cell wall biosynthesis